MVRGGESGTRRFARWQGRLAEPSAAVSAKPPYRKGKHSRKKTPDLRHLSKSPASGLFLIMLILSIMSLTLSN
jgi:hypothetical protein